jgi:cation:H+ antiporter
VVWLIFLVAAGAVFVAGTAIARAGDEIARRTPLGHVWVGALLVAGATSLPELATDTVAVLRDAPDLATGDLFGSNMANMGLLALTALAFRRARLFQRDALGLALTASVAIVLTGIAALFIVARLEQSVAGAFSFGSLVLLAAAAGAWFLFPEYREAIAEPPAEEAAAGARRQSVLRPAVSFVASAAAIIAAGSVLVWSAERIAEITGLQQTFVGVLGLAIATSLPELSASFAAVRLDALDMAVGNLYGSNALNMTILVWLDAIYVEAPLLDNAHSSNAAAALVAMLLMMVGLTNMVLRAERRRFPVDPTALVILVGYVMGLLMVWSVSER